jgi:hypothetical protein
MEQKMKIRLIFWLSKALGVQIKVRDAHWGAKMGVSEIVSEPSLTIAAEAGPRPATAA